MRKPPNMSGIGVPFRGGSVLEMFTDPRFQPRLTATRNPLQIVKVNHFNIYTTAKNKQPTTRTAGPDMKKI